MIPLESNRRVLTWLCGVPPPDSCTKREKITYRVLATIIIMTHLLSVISSTMFIYRNMSVNLVEALYSLFHTVAALQTLYQSIGKVLLHRKIIVIFDRLEEIYNESK